MRAAPRPSRLLAATAVAIGAVLCAPGSRAQAPPRRSGIGSCFDAAEAAQPLLRDRKLVEAQGELQICAREACPNPARSDCRGWLDEVTRALPTVVFRAHEARAGGDVPVDDVRVSVDGAVVVPGHLDATPVPLDPGERIVRFEHGKYPPVEQHIELHEGEIRRVVEAAFRAPDAAAASPGPAPSSSGDTTAPPEEPVAPPFAGSRPVPVAAWALLGGSVVALGVGAALEASGLSARSGLFGCERTCPESRVDSARNTVMAGDIALGVGAALFAGTAYVYLTRPAVGAHAAAADLRLRLGGVGTGFGAGIDGTL